MSKVLYTAVVLDENSRQKLIKYFKAIIPENWNIICDHMTINLGDIDPELKNIFDRNYGINIPLNVIDYAIDDKIIAVGVTGFPSKNNKPHITIAYDKNSGAKPKMSNDLIEWKPLKRSFMVVGKPSEIFAQ